MFSTIPRDLYEGNNKQAWLDLNRGFCHLCQEPIGGSFGVHISDRDHTNLQFFLYLYASYPRGDASRRARGAVTTPAGTTVSRGGRVMREGGSDTSLVTSAESSAVGSTAAHRRALRRRGDCPLYTSESVIDDVQRLCPSLFHFATAHTQIDHLHVMDDAMRRAELEALLLHLSQPPHPALSHVLQGKSPFTFWYSGERMWKYHISRLVTQMLPPMSAGVMTNFTQKCWGRTNGERMYDALRLQRMKAYYGWQPYESKEKKAFFVRQLLWELLCAEMRPEVDELTKHIAALTLRRMAFEMVFLQTMDYMHRIQRVYELLGRPSVEDLQQLNLL